MAKENSPWGDILYYLAIRQKLDTKQNTRRTQRLRFCCHHVPCDNSRKMVDTRLGCLKLQTDFDWLEYALAALQPTHLGRLNSTGRCPHMRVNSYSHRRKG